MIKKFLIIFAAIIFLNCSTCAAEDLKFIDSNGDDGYFIDMDTIKFGNSNTFSVDLIIIRLNLNQMEVTDLLINYAEKNYLIRSTRTLSYDERTEINSDDSRRIPKSYSEKSLMGDIVNIVVNGGE